MNNLQLCMSKVRSKNKTTKQQEKFLLVVVIQISVYSSYEATALHYPSLAGKTD